MSALVKSVGFGERWTEAERVKALKRIVPSVAIRKVLRRTGRHGTRCRRLSREFMIWFVIAMSLFCRDSYRQVFRWLCRFRRGGTPGRSTLCEARRSVGAAPLRLLAEEVIQLQGQPDMPQVFQPIRRLPDGSYLAKVYRASWYRTHDTRGMIARIIEYTFDDPGRPGSGQKHRLLTTLLSAREHPANELITLYHERWEDELAIDELKTHQQERPVLRSETPVGVVQEIYGLLLGHYVVRKLICEAAATIDMAPRRISFVNTLKILRCRLPECPRSPRGIRRWYSDLIVEVAEEVLEPRRNRINPRVIKRKMSRWLKKRPKHRNYPQPTRQFRHSIVMLN